MPIDWQVDLPVDKGVVLLDIGFTGTDPNHGAFSKHPEHGLQAPFSQKLAGATRSRVQACMWC